MMFFNRTDNLSDSDFALKVRDALHEPVVRLKWDENLDDLRDIDSS